MSSSSRPDGNGVPPPRKTVDDPPAGGNNRASGEPGENPGVPGFRTWRGVYWFVFGCFTLVVVLLTIFSRVFA